MTTPHHAYNESNNGHFMNERNANNTKDPRTALIRVQVAYLSFIVITCLHRVYTSSSSFE